MGFIGDQHTDLLAFDRLSDLFRGASHRQPVLQIPTITVFFGAVIQPALVIGDDNARQLSLAIEVVVAAAATFQSAIVSTLAWGIGDHGVFWNAQSIGNRARIVVQTADVG